MPQCAVATCVSGRMHVMFSVKLSLCSHTSGVHADLLSLDLHVPSFWHCRCMAELGCVMTCHWLACGAVQEPSGLPMGQMMSTWRPLQSWSWPSCPNCREFSILYEIAVPQQVLQMLMTMLPNALNAFMSCGII